MRTYAQFPADLFSKKFLTQKIIFCAVQLIMYAFLIYISSHFPPDPPKLFLLQDWNYIEKKGW